MKIRFISFLSLFFVAGYAYAVPATVNYIFDGDTFAATVHLEDGINVSTRVRLMNVDTPEIHGMCEREINMANRAKNRLAELLPTGSKVELKSIKDDKYLGRIDAYVLIEGGKDVGEILIKENLGRVYSGGKREGWCE